MMRLALSLALVVILLDQASKWYILEVVMRPPRTIEITSFFNLVLTFNPGVSFGVSFGGGEWQPYILSLVAIGIVVALLIWLKRQPSQFFAVSVGMIVGGALGNVIDRLRFRAVVDFLDVHLGGYHWPAFNIADSAITLGVVLILIDGLFRDSEEGKKAESKETDS